MRSQNIAFSIPWNLFLITVGSVLVGIGLKSIVIPNGMITGGFSGAGIMLFYFTGILTPGTWYLLLNIPVFIVGWLFISKRFLLYSIYGSLVLTIATDFVWFEIHVDDMMLAAIAGGVIIGAGSGITFRSLGSLGGNDIISIILNRKYGIRIGSYFFSFNLALFLFSFGLLKTDIILYSMAMSYIATQMIEYFIALFNQRKMIFIISNSPREISNGIMTKMKRGVTFLKGEGSYSGKKKEIIMTVVNTFQIKRIEEIAFSIDPNAFLITENTLNVLGKGFSKRKIY